jgi:hypothetical protein
MRYGYVLWCLVAGGFLNLAVSSTIAQSKRELGVWVLTRGSVPPVPDWFSCARKFKEKPYDKIQAQACLQSILSHPGIEKGKVSFHPGKSRDDLFFRVKSPSLPLTDVDFDVAEADIAPLQDFLAINGSALHSGAIYTETGDASTMNALDLLLRSQGERAGISRTVHLDYKQNVAQVAFKVWDGPPTDRQPLLPPYAEPCKILNANFNWSDADDLSPVSFVERQMKTKWCGCFSERDVQDDLAMLKGMKFLTEANVSVEGAGAARSISVRLRSRPIPVASISVKGYGLLKGRLEGEIPPLSIREGDSYSHSASADAALLLKKAFMQQGRQVRVFTDVEITAAGKANLDFGVLAYPDDLVYIDGAKFDGSFPDQSDLNPDPVLGERIADGVVFAGRLWLRGTTSYSRKVGGLGPSAW